MQGRSHINMANSWLGKPAKFHEHVIATAFDEAFRYRCGKARARSCALRTWRETRAGAMAGIAAAWRRLVLPHDWRKYSR
ncbi:unnamed protein product [Ciceribacter selenitireducens ATCC BAA-1503]|uniref:Uncharacterized protein n=1 Tax=Ciceribacter selenitireducens ATCC BAA-1503 TaxID=1336235 RepID=A0A376AKD7_9HYPH|nr:unnamed protein product [Ciceribacter selenitireducens ATCC BAA-1503]